MATISLLPSAHESHLEALAALPLDLALREAVPFLERLSDEPAFLNAHVLPLLREAREADDWFVAYSCNGRDGSYSLQVFFWPPGSRIQIHDHTSWGAYCCVAGSVLEERYERLDDGSQLEYAHLKKAWQLSWSREDGVSTVLPYNEGIHRVGNPGAKTAISVHLWPPTGGGGRQGLRALP
jgi:predicted metal-dependent enzyme (double-stranded beta helix superfamily)